MTAPVTLYTTRFCPYCIRAKHLLEHKNVDFHEIPVDGDPATREKMTALSGRRTVPQIWIGERHIGGYDDLAALERGGRLDELLEAAGTAATVN